VIDHRKIKFVFDDQVRLGKTFFHIAFDQLMMRAKVTLGKIMQARRVLGHRLFDANHRRKLLVVDVDLAQRLFRRRAVQRRNRSHGCPAKSRGSWR
jgi:hypothetical protein